MDLSMLNPQQRLAAETLEGPVLILAGAGSGKTRALTYRAANLMDHGVAPWHLLCLTFTNKAAREMKERITKLVGEKAEDAWISTFHSTCARILRRDIEKLGYQRSFVIFDSDDQQRLLKEVFKQLNVDDHVISVKDAARAISDMKNRAMSPDEWFQQSARDRRSQEMHDIMVAYGTRLRELNALDFDDLLLRTLELFVEHPPVLESYQDRFWYVMVDEYQDTNYAQYQLIRLLTQKRHNLCVVGDDDQSIYGWRGADLHNILDFEKDYPETVVIKLEQNYRSTANILDAANQVIAHNTERKDKQLWTSDAPGELIHTFTATDERAEAGWVITKILQLHKKGVNYSDIAVLYRSNQQSRVIEDMLTKKAIPFRVFGGPRFYDRREVRDVVAYLRVLVNPQDDISLARIINVPKRAIGDSTVQEMQRYAREQEMPLYAALTDIPPALSSRPRRCVAEFAALLNRLLVMKETQPLSEFVSGLIEETGLLRQYEAENSEENQSRIGNIRELMAAVTQFEKDYPGAKLEDYLESITLVSDQDSSYGTSGYVTLMTLHSAKGLEYDNVFITGMEEKVFPSSYAVNEGREEEERRLCYVGITRAKQRLYLSRAASRMFMTQPNYNEASRFLSEIPARLLKDESEAIERVYRVTPPQPRQPRSAMPRVPMARAGEPLNIPGVTRGFRVPSPAAQLAPVPASNFAEGDRVMHRKFGEGFVKRIEGDRIEVSFAAYGDKVFRLSLAPIVKLED